MSEQSKYDSNRAGAIERGAGTWWVMNKSGGLFEQRSSGQVVRTLSGMRGFLDKFDLAWDDGNVEKKVAPCWKATLGIWISENETWNMDISALYQDAITNLLNPLCATGLDWDHWIKLSLYKKDETQKSARLSVWVEDTDAKTQPQTWLWNGSNGYVGVPASVEYPGPPGQPSVFDHNPVRRFMLNYAVQFYERFNGRKYDGDVVQRYDAYLESLVNGASQSKPAPATAAPAATTQPAKAPAVFLKSLSDLMSKAAGKGVEAFNTVVKTAMPHYQLYGFTAEQFKTHLITHITQVCGVGYTVGDDFFAIAKVDDSPPFNGDDLPF